MAVGTHNPFDFDLVKQFDAMRSSIGGGLAPYQPPEIKAPEPFAPSFSPKPVAGGAGHFVGDGHNHGGGAKGGSVPLGPLKLVSYGGKQFDQSILSNVQAMEKQFGLRITSGYRDPAHNAKVGGVKNSWHLKGRAVDMVGSSAAMQNAEIWARKNGAREALRHAVPGGGFHLHVAW